MLKKGKKRTGKPKTKKSTGKRARPGRIFIYALALAALSGGGYLAFDTIKRRRRDKQNSEAPDTIVINNNLPNQRLSLPPATSSARQTSSSVSTAVQIVFNPADVALRLYRAAQRKNIDEVLAILKEIKSVQDYSSVSEYYKKQGFVSRTIVTDLLDYAFKTNEANKKLIRNEFLRMGLKVNSSGIWSLQGIRLFRDLITLRDTIAIDARNNRIPVKRNTILGDEIEVANGMTWFRSIDSTILKVPTRDVKYT